MMTGLEMADKVFCFDDNERKTTSEWIELRKEVDCWIANAPKKEVDDFVHSGAGEMMNMIID